MYRLAIALNRFDIWNTEHEWEKEWSTQEQQQHQPCSPTLQYIYMKTRMYPNHRAQRQTNLSITFPIPGMCVSNVSHRSATICIDFCVGHMHAMRSDVAILFAQKVTSLRYTQNSRSYRFLWNHKMCPRADANSHTLKLYLKSSP